jgi:hypothetical protein
MHDAVHPRDELVQRSKVGDVTRATVRAGDRVCDSQIQHAHLVPVRQQPFDSRTSNVAHATGDKNFHS